MTVASGPIRYVVSSVRTFSKGSLADHAQRLFSQEVRGRLVLVTCEDWNGSAYLSNVVVVATPVGLSGGRRNRLSRRRGSVK